MHDHLLVLVVREHHYLTLLCHYLMVSLELTDLVSIDVVVSLLHLTLLLVLLDLDIHLIVVDLLDKLVLLDHLSNLNMSEADWRVLRWLVHLLDQLLFILPNLFLPFNDLLLHLLDLVGTLVVIHVVLRLAFKELHGALWDYLVLRMYHSLAFDEFLNLGQLELTFPKPFILSSPDLLHEIGLVTDLQHLILQHALLDLQVVVQVLREYLRKALEHSHLLPFFTYEIVYNHDQFLKEEVFLVHLVESLGFELQFADSDGVVEGGAVLVLVYNVLHNSLVGCLVL